VLHFTGRVARPMPWVLWGILLAGCLLPLLPVPVGLPRIHIGLSTLYLAILGAVAVKLIASRTHPAPWVRAATSAAIIAAIAVGLHDLAIWFSWLDFDRLSFSPHAAPLLTLAVGALVISRHLDAARALALSNATLEQRVAERGAEIERVQVQLREAESERARANERQRILSDIHDGLGSSLVSLLSVTQSGKITNREVERRVHDALVELRVAVDAQDIVDGDLITALASVRYRMRDALQAAGITLDWRVGDMPPLDHLPGRAILDIQRMMLEALANVIRHAGATRIAVATHHDDQTVSISIADNGCGFDIKAARPAGRGLMTMQRRAAAVGGTCTIESNPGQGTRVVFTLKRG
jgi:signal transduction histidine kinase